MEKEASRNYAIRNVMNQFDLDYETNFEELITNENHIAEITINPYDKTPLQYNIEKYGRALKITDARGEISKKDLEAVIQANEKIASKLGLIRVRVFSGNKKILNGFYNAGYDFSGRGGYSGDKII